MKTKFILHGGFRAKETNEDNSAFYIEILKDVPENALVLAILFAKDEDRISRAITKITDEFNKYKGQKNISIEIANEENLIKQLRSVDIVYLNGGITLQLLEVLKRYPDFSNALDSKIVAGESAGANVLGTFFYSPHADSVSEGLGILPVKIIPHYTEDQKGKLDGVGIGLEEVFLPEYTYKVFYK